MTSIASLDPALFGFQYSVQFLHTSTGWSPPRLSSRLRISAWLVLVGGVDHQIIGICAQTWLFSLDNDYTAETWQAFLLCVTLTPWDTACLNGCNLCVHYITDGVMASQRSSNPEVKALVRWLKSVPVDQDTINKVIFVFLLPRLLRITHLPTVNPNLCDPVF